MSEPLIGEGETPRPLAVITGASGGIGEAFACELAARGCDLYLVARSEARLHQLAQQLAHTYLVRVDYLALNLAEAASAQTLMWHLNELHRPINWLVNNAGFGLQGDLARMPGDRVQQMMMLNMVTLANLTHQVLPGMVAAHQGRIVNIASTAAFLPGPGMAVYFATKAFVLSFSEAVAWELRGTGCTVTAVCPGPTKTGFEKNAELADTLLFRTGGLMSAEAVARAGVRGALAGRRVLVVGLRNKIGTALSRFVPHRVLLLIVSMLTKSRSLSE